MDEFKKYIVVFDLLTFLEFSESFISKFYNFTNIITLIIKVMCIIYIIVAFIKDLLIFVDVDLYNLFFLIF